MCAMGRKCLFCSSKPNSALKSQNGRRLTFDEGWECELDNSKERVVEGGVVENFVQKGLRLVWFNFAPMF